MGEIRFNNSFGKMRSKDHARSRDSKTVRDSYAPKTMVDIRAKNIRKTLKPTLSDELLLEFLEEF